MAAATGREVAGALGRVGVWLFGRAMEDDAAEFARRIEQLGYGALWVGGGNTNAGAFDRLAALTGATQRLSVVTGITSIWAWEPGELAGRSAALASKSAGRFVLGLGVSHAHLVEHLGKVYARPFSAMVDYLEALQPALDAAGGAPVVLAALGDKMLTFSAQRSAGAHPYFTPVSHTAHARAVLGPEPLLGVELAFVLDDDPVTARATARQYMEHYLVLPNYAGNLARFGFGEADLAAGGSDRLVDEIVAWGTPEQVAARVAAHLDAGADHVCIQPLSATGRRDDDALAALAPLLVTDAP